MSHCFPKWLYWTILQSHEHYMSIWFDLLAVQGTLKSLLLISWLQSLSAVILEPRTIKSVTVSIFPPIYLPWSDGTGCHDLTFLNVKFSTKEWRMTSKHKNCVVLFLNSGELLGYFCYQLFMIKFHCNLRLYFVRFVFC